ncbi:MAG: hypothetical protein ABII82_06655 [Verrucomicrobiota bacterium]
MNHPCVRIVGSFEELVSTPFAGAVNALCWPRTLGGDFDEIARVVGPLDEITTVDDESLLDLPLSAAGRAAREVLLADQKRLRDAGLDPSLDLIPAYPREAVPGPVPVDVYDWHADSANTLADTFLCSYTVAASEGLANAEAVRRIDIPETRAELLRIHGGADDDVFKAWMRDRCYDLHYAASPHARPFSFGFGNLWRIATRCPGSPVLPCIHRAPVTRPGQPPRLLLIS